MNTAPSQLSGGNILIVDDNPSNLRLLSSTLRQRGFEVRSAINGSIALIGAQAEPPDLLLLDVSMPDINGYEVCRQLKSKPETANIPVIFISALDEVFDKVQAFQVGGADYITKPFNIDEVIARVEHQITIGQLQRQLQHKNQQLEESNCRLERFAYIASHDLQQPLQNIINTSELIALKYKNVLDEQAKNYLARIEESSARMCEFIQDLLDYSRVGSQAREMVPVNCHLLMEQVLENLATVVARKKALIEYEFLPTIMADPTQILQLFQNLLSNSLKFQAPGKVPEIKISAQERDKDSASTQWLFSIQDNGIGIEKEQFEEVFDVFQRLGNARNYPGTGIGLATCKQIVTNHGGHIWLDSEVGVGTTFFFTL